MQKVYFFGYGANRNREKIYQITGKYPSLEFGAILEGYQLCVQNLDLITEKPRKILTELYGERFKAYTIKKGNGIVSGMIWEITPEDLEKIKEWEFVGDWKEIIEITIRSAGNKTIQAITEKVTDDAQVIDIVDGLSYDEFEFTIKNDSKSKEEFYTQAQIDYIKKQLKTII